MKTYFRSSITASIALLLFVFTSGLFGQTSFNNDPKTFRAPSIKF